MSGASTGDVEGVSEDGRVKSASVMCVTRLLRSKHGTSECGELSRCHSLTQQSTHTYDIYQPRCTAAAKSRVLPPPNPQFTRSPFPHSLTRRRPLQ